MSKIKFQITWTKHEDFTLSIQNFPSTRWPVRARSSFSWLMVNGRTKLETLRTHDRGCWAGLVASSSGAAAASTTSGLDGANASAATSTATLLTTSIFSTFSSDEGWSPTCLLATEAFAGWWKLGLPSRTSSADSGLASGTNVYFYIREYVNNYWTWIE